MTSTLAACAGTPSSIASVRPGQETVVLLHGLGRSARAMAPLEKHLEEAGYQVVSIDYPTLRETPERVMAEVARQIDACCVGEASTLHFVGHSLGGLVARAYIAEHQPAGLGRVVVIGSPNKGTAVVDHYRDKWWFEILGPTAAMLGTGEHSFGATLEPPHYPLGVIAGHKPSNNDDVLPGADDGLVTIDSTRVEGMTDFLVVPTGHAGLRYDEDVARQTIHFLSNGRFSGATRS